MVQMTINRKFLVMFSSIHFDAPEHIRLVPPFQEKEFDKHFLHFEKVAENLKMAKGVLDFAFAKCYN